MIYFIFYFSACDQTFTSTSDVSSKNGSFIAPNFLNPCIKQADNKEKCIVQQCTFTFIGQKGERVILDFEDFELKGKKRQIKIIISRIRITHTYSDIL